MNLNELKNYTLAVYLSPVRGYTRHCPNCGARMDGEVEGKRK